MFSQIIQLPTKIVMNIIVCISFILRLCGATGTVIAQLLGADRLLGDLSIVLFYCILLKVAYVLRNCSLSLICWTSMVLSTHSTNMCGVGIDTAYGCFIKMLQHILNSIMTCTYDLYNDQACLYCILQSLVNAIRFGVRIILNRYVFPFYIDIGSVNALVALTD